MSLGFGVTLGCIYGILSSTEYTLRRFEGLGSDYMLGRLALQETEDYRIRIEKLAKK